MIKIIIDLLMLIPVFIYVVFKQFTCNHLYAKIDYMFQYNYTCINCSKFKKNLTKRELLKSQILMESEMESEYD